MNNSYFVEKQNANSTREVTVSNLTGAALKRAATRAQMHQGTVLEIGAYLGDGDYRPHARKENGKWYDVA